jgi:MFS family permease
MPGIVLAWFGVEGDAWSVAHTAHAAAAGVLSDGYSLALWSLLLLALAAFALRRHMDASLLPSADPGSVSEPQQQLQQQLKLGASRARALRYRYLAVYALMVAGDWLQGPYVYALYEAYDFAHEQIAVLFVAGFCSSMVAGTLVGSLADRFGRKRLSVVYCALYAASCVTKHNSGLGWLLLGRVLGGIATSLLFSVFESWLVGEHGRLGLDDASLGETLSAAVLLNSVVGIVSGAVAQRAADVFPFAPVPGHESWYWGGYTAPFDLAILALGAGCALMHVLWGDNFGESTAANSGAEFKEALQLVRSDRLVLAVGLASALFEGSMYAFVFMWTPALNGAQGEPSPPYGTIFSAFMVACMLGSQLFDLASARLRLSPQRALTGVLLIGAASLAVASLSAAKGSSNKYPAFLGFIAFEVCVGVYFPAMGTLKSQVVPNSHRAAVYNIFRVPLNLIVLVVLLGQLSVTATFSLCAVMLFAAAALIHLVVARALPAAHPFGLYEVLGNSTSRAPETADEA